MWPLPQPRSQSALCGDETFLARVTLTGLESTAAPGQVGGGSFEFGWKAFAASLELGPFRRRNPVQH